MEKKQIYGSKYCASCGREVPEERVICKCCEKCNGYSAARWLAAHLQNEIKEMSKVNNSEY